MLTRWEAEAPTEPPKGWAGWDCSSAGARGFRDSQKTPFQHSISAKISQRGVEHL